MLVVEEEKQEEKKEEETKPEEEKKEEETKPEESKEVAKPSRAEKRIKQLLGRIKGQDERIVALENVLEKEEEEEETPSKKKSSLDRRVSTLEKGKKEDILEEDIAEQLTDFQNEHSFSSREVNKIGRIIDAEGLIDEETNEIDFEAALKIYNAEKEEDEQEYKDRSSESKGGKTGGKASAKVSVKPAKLSVGMSSAEIRKAGEEMIPDSF